MSHRVDCRRFVATVCTVAINPAGWAKSGAGAGDEPPRGRTWSVDLEGLLRVGPGPFTRASVSSALRWCSPTESLPRRSSPPRLRPLQPRARSCRMDRNGYPPTEKTSTLRSRLKVRADAGAHGDRWLDFYHSCARTGRAHAAPLL